MSPTWWRRGGAMVVLAGLAGGALISCELRQTCSTICDCRGGCTSEEFDRCVLTLSELDDGDCMLSETITCLNEGECSSLDGHAEYCARDALEDEAADGTLDVSFCESRVSCDTLLDRCLPSTVDSTLVNCLGSSYPNTPPGDPEGVCPFVCATRLDTCIFDQPAYLECLEACSQVDLDGEGGDGGAGGAPTTTGVRTGSSGADTSSGSFATGGGDYNTGSGSGGTPCGDGSCDLPGGESCAVCPNDCGTCFCGNGSCDPSIGETCDTCADCPSCECGDGFCGADEYCDTCPTDCCAGEECGDQLCDVREECGSCSGDCDPECSEVCDSGVGWWEGAFPVDLACASDSCCAEFMECTDFGGDVQGCIDCLRSGIADEPPCDKAAQCVIDKGCFGG